MQDRLNSKYVSELYELTTQMQSKRHSNFLSFSRPNIFIGILKNFYFLFLDFKKSALVDLTEVKSSLSCKSYIHLYFKRKRCLFLFFKLYLEYFKANYFIFYL